MILPRLDRSFDWQETPAGPALASRALSRHAAHFFTTRGWRLGRQAPQPDEEPWIEIAGIAGVPLDRLVRLRQVHGAAVVEAAPGEIREGDIAVSADPALALVVQVADCVPLLLFDPGTGAAAVAHAGWRGLAKRVPQVAVKALLDRYGARPRTLIAAAGPSIGACCYEVGADVESAFHASSFAGTGVERWFLDAPAADANNPSLPGVPLRAPAGKRFFDGWGCLRDQLIEAGLLPGSIDLARTCTASQPEIYCSYRRDGAPAGRLAGVIRPGTRRER